tara:strand:+ start:1093 stop:1287 length:195 start_codon:yes stop_codon:yes gene_type:complete
MIFNVPKMSCGHCTSSIEKSIKATDASAVITTDLETRQVTVVSTLPLADIQQAIVDAGYETEAA